MRVAQELAEQSMVLLQNKGNFLPLNSASVKKIVVVGSDALSPTTGGEGSGRVDPSVSDLLFVFAAFVYSGEILTFACGPSCTF